MAIQTGYLLGMGDTGIDAQFTVCDDCGKELDDDQTINDKLWSWKKMQYERNDEICLSCYIRRYCPPVKCSLCDNTTEDREMFYRRGKPVCKTCKGKKKLPRLACEKCGVTDLYEILYSHDGYILCSDCIAERLDVKPS